MHQTYLGSLARTAEVSSVPTSTDRVRRKVINLALQGVGSHGAYTWGVLDRLLEDKRLFIEGITATSAGTISAVVLADGLAAGGREGAKHALRRFWQKVSETALWSIFQPSPIDRESWTRLSEQFFRFDMWSSAGIRLPNGEAAA
jgi:predicted acylesterase/phospholipase RssA